MYDGIKVRRFINEYGKFTRSFDDDIMLDDILYDYGLNGFRCHSGQRKLFYSELELFTKIHEIDGNKLFTDMLVVYVGAAEGHHTKVLIDMFPDLHYLLYDPRKFIVEESDNVKIMTGDMGMFTLNSIHFVKEYANGREIVFICDMRLFVTEEQIWTEMEYQRDWGILLNAKYMLLKFRLPYVNEDTLSRDYTPYNEELIGDKVVVNESTMCDHPAIYLDGELLSQIYAPIKSTESRLFVKRRNDGKYDMKYYNFYKHENVCFYFNSIYRHLKFTYKNSDDMQNHLLGYDDGYESVCEYYLIDKMLTSFNKPSSHQDIILELNYINNALITVTNGNNVIFDIFKTWESDINSTAEWDKQPLRRFLILNKIDLFSTISCKIIEYCTLQINKIRNSNILDQDQVNKQLSLYCIKRNSLYYIENGMFVFNTRSFNKIVNTANQLYQHIVNSLTVT